MRLKRQLGVFGATVLGMGSIVGTGVFVSIGLAAGAAGPAVLAAIVLAALLALCNAMSSAQLAASHPVSGGTYEYGYRYLSPAAGFTAGWMFLCAKSASAATAALGFSGYLLHLAGAPAGSPLTPLAVAAVVGLTLVVALGVRRANWANVLIVTVTLGSLVAFVLAGLPAAVESGREHLTPLFGSRSAGPASAAHGLLQASALMFVAYTGYGRIATLGEEVRDPRRTIPRAVLATVALSTVLYLAVSLVAVAVAGADRLGAATETTAAPLELIAEDLPWAALPSIVAAGAVTAMLGVLLNLILGLSRVVLAMGRRRDVPGVLARVDAAGGTPYAAVIAVGVVVAALASIGSVRITWSFSAFTVLVYYALTNLAALRLPAEQRLFPACFPRLGLAGCAGLAFWVEWPVWLAGLALIGVGLAWHRAARRRAPAAP